MAKCEPKIYLTERVVKKFRAACEAKYPDKDFFILPAPLNASGLRPFGYCVAFFLKGSDRAVYISALKGFRP